MYDNKVLINLYVLSLGKNYELFLPVNEKVGNILSLLDKAMFDSIDYDRKYTIINLESSDVYNYKVIIRNTNIKNCSKIMMV